MKYFILTIIQAVILSTIYIPSAMAGGDIGGGGVAKVVKLTPAEITRLQQQPDKDAAFTQWLQTIDDKKEFEILKNIFEQHVVPQIK